MFKILDEVSICFRLKKQLSQIKFYTRSNLKKDSVERGKMVRNVLYSLKAGLLKNFTYCC